MLSVIALMIITALANMWIGWEKGDRYTGSLAVALAGFAFFGWVGSLIGLALLLWRFVGWHKALDMGRNEGTVLRDTLVMSAIALVPAITLAVGLQSWLPITLVVTMPACYGFAMWAFPWKPNIDHIKIAEGTSGAVFALTGALAI